MRTRPGQRQATDVRRLTVWLALAVGLLARSPTVAAQSLVSPAARVALQDDPAGAALRLLEEVGPVAFPLAIRVELNAQSFSAAAIESRLAPIERRSLPLWLAIPAPAAEQELEAWRSLLQAILARPRSTLTILEVVVDTQPAPLASFAMQVAATETRARRDRTLLALGGPGMTDPVRRIALYSAQLAPYVDLLTLPGNRDDTIATWLEQVDPSAQVALLSPAETPSAGLPLRIVDQVITDFDTEIAVRAWNATSMTVAAIQALSPLAPLLTHMVAALDPAGVGLRLTIGPEDVTATMRHRLLFDNDTFATYFVYWGEPNAAPLGISLTLPVEGRPGIHDLLTRERPAVSGYTREAATGRVQAALPLTGRPMLVDFNEDATAPLVERSEISAPTQLSVAEIIARHQQAQLAQDVLVRHYSAVARMRQYFRPTITDAGYDVVTENRYFVEGTAVEWEELSFSVNGSRWGTDRPPFPLLQPERVLSLPLQLRLDEGYTYRLRGTEAIDGVDCYVVQFDPIRKDSALYRGTIWIDRRTFARVRVHAVQSGMAAPVVSTDETMRYAHVATIENQPIFLFVGLSARQVVLIAGRNLLIEKEVDFSGFQVNDKEFEAARRAARASDRIMFRETDAGLRHYVKDGDGRVISQDQTSRAKAMAMGVYLDPSYAFPLPIFGINYLNFSLGGSNQTQLALLFGGVLAAGNIQRPALGSNRLSASLDFFAIAVPSSDRVYGPGGEAESARVLTWPLSTGVNLGWQATPYQKATLHYQLRFDAYLRDRTTAATFQPPSSTLTNGLGGAWEYRRGGYNVMAAATWYARSRWQEWGDPASPDPTGVTVAAARRYVKYSLSVSRDVLIGPFQKFNINGAWFGGRDLDRFVQYQFGMFDDTRIHGVPASGVRFSELAMARGSYSFNVFEQYRLDLFLEHAWGREDAAARDWQSVPGIGAAFNFRAPWNTILRTDIGKSLLPDRYRGLGSTTLQVLLLKPMR
jgi:hypothetical protein